MLQACDLQRMAEQDFEGAKALLLNALATATEALEEEEATLALRDLAGLL